MNKQLIFCLETNRRANTDWIYIQELIKRLYKTDNSIKFTPVYMGSKQRYRSKEVRRAVKEDISMYPGESHVLMCIDTDNLNSNPLYRREFDEIKAYCYDNDYNLIWFNIDIEDVFQGHRIESKSKVKEAATFKRKKKINELDLSVLEKSMETQHGSNIVGVLKSILG